MFLSVITKSQGGFRSKARIRTKRGYPEKDAEETSVALTKGAEVKRIAELENDINVGRIVSSVLQNTYWIPIGYDKQGFLLQLETKLPPELAYKYGNLSEGVCKPGYAAAKMTSIYPKKKLKVFLDNIDKASHSNPLTPTRTPNLNVRERLRTTLTRLQSNISSKLLFIHSHPLCQQFAVPLSCKRCIIVGNGGILYNKSLGSRIDEYDVVVSCYSVDMLNGAPIAGYKRDVGTKTTLRITYPEGAIQKSEHYEGDSLFVFSAFKPIDFKWLKNMVFKEKLNTKIVMKMKKGIKYKIVKKKSRMEGFWKSVAQHVPRKPAEMRILNPYFIQEAAFQFIGLPFNNGLMGKGSLIPHSHLPKQTGLHSPSSELPNVSSSPSCDPLSPPIVPLSFPTPPSASSKSPRDSSSPLPTPCPCANVDLWTSLQGPGPCADVTRRTRLRHRGHTPDLPRGFRLLRFSPLWMGVLGPPLGGLGGNIPTLGTVAITMALHNCDEVAVAGFGYDMTSPQAPLHYYESVKMSAIKESWTHNISKEKEFLRKLVKANVITDLTKAAFRHFCRNNELKAGLTHGAENRPPAPAPLSQAWSLPEKTKEAEDMWQGTEAAVCGLCIRGVCSNHSTMRRPYSDGNGSRRNENREVTNCRKLRDDGVMGRAAQKNPP
ncbi:hypothetical protein CCH79_00017018 [Gambusia affinis]|uniref:Uncharacterized protein n=1 Tax=Gambusia affinis TaxID=33528 RepID=A0A315UNV8_GAMAF|nr:hypothetical protein CCH79_00017018 [Gambusia affinis]